MHPIMEPSIGGRLLVRTGLDASDDVVGGADQRVHPLGRTDSRFYKLVVVNPLNREMSRSVRFEATVASEKRQPIGTLIGACSYSECIGML